MPDNQLDKARVQDEIHLFRFIRSHLSLPGTNLQHAHAVWLLKQFDAQNADLQKARAEIDRLKQFLDDRTL